MRDKRSISLSETSRCCLMMTQLNMGEERANGEEFEMPESREKKREEDRREKEAATWKERRRGRKASEASLEKKKAGWKRRGEKRE